MWRIVASSSKRMRWMCATWMCSVDKTSMDDYQKYRFSVTCETSDAAVLHCLRAICQWAEQYMKPQIGWGGTTERSWESNGGKLTLRFTATDYRKLFIEK